MFGFIDLYSLWFVECFLFFSPRFHRYFDMLYQVLILHIWHSFAHHPYAGNFLELIVAAWQSGAEVACDLQIFERLTKNTQTCKPNCSAVAAVARLTSPVLLRDDGWCMLDPDRSIPTTVILPELEVGAIETLEDCWVFLIAPVILYIINMISLYIFILL